MALKATIYKATVNVADLDRNQFLDASLTLARHPSETQERMMLRLLAWLKYADERLQFTRGLCADDEPEAWLRNDHLGIDLWIELGLPDERRIKKACTQAAEVALFAYNSRAAQIWWQQNQSKCAQFANLSVWYLDDEQLAKVSAFADRTMTLQATIQDGVIWLSDDKQGYSLAEEIANSVSHGIGLVFGIVGLVLLLVQAVDLNASATAITSYSLYGGSMILLFLASTLYHAIPHQRAKMWLKKFDHCAIYLLIAGTYTPFLLVGLDSPLARGLMIVIWSLALLGILFKLTIAHRFKILSLVTYLAMGWLSLVVIYEMAVKLAAGSVTLLAVGGVVYSLGVIFYVCKRIPYNHAIWHGFVLGGSVCHFLAIYLYIGQA